MVIFFERTIEVNNKFLALPLIITTRERAGLVALFCAGVAVVGGPGGSKRTCADNRTSKFQPIEPAPAPLEGAEICGRCVSSFSSSSPWECRAPRFPPASCPGTPGAALTAASTTLKTAHWFCRA